MNVREKSQDKRNEVMFMNSLEEQIHSWSSSKSGKIMIIKACHAACKQWLYRYLQTALACKAHGLEAGVVQSMAFAVGVEHVPKRYALQDMTFIFNDIRKATKMLADEAQDGVMYKLY